MLDKPIVGEWKDSQCKECRYNDKEAYDLCDKLGVQPSDYKWNRLLCPLRREID